VNTTLPLINPTYSYLVHTAFAATALAILAVCNPHWETIRLIGMTVLTGVSYGIVNDMIACRDCIEYFTVGYVYDGRNLKNRLLNTLNPTLNALVWGAVATWYPSFIAGIYLGLLTKMPFPGSIVKISAKRLAPYLAFSAQLALVISHIASRLAQSSMPLNYVKYEGVPVELQSSWEACNIRNMLGYRLLMMGSCILAIAIIAARKGFFIL
jgi:hypothetical protein